MKKIVSLCLCTAVFIALTGCMSRAEAQKYQQGMSEYLNNKYGMEFVVGKVSLTGNEGFGYHTYVATAYPKDNPALELDVVYSGSYMDTYLSCKWSYEGRVIVKKQLADIYGEDIPLQFTFNINYPENKHLTKEDYVLTYPEVIQKYDDISHFELIYTVFSDLLIDKEIESERAYKIYEKLKCNINNYSIYIYYIPSNYKIEFLKFFNNYYKSSIKEDKMYKEGNLFNILLISNNHPVNSIESTLKNFIY